MLSRFWEKEYFYVKSGTNKILKEDIVYFDKQISDENNFDLADIWEFDLSLEVPDTEFDLLLSIIPILKSLYDKKLKGIDFLKSSEIWLNFSVKNFLVWNSNWKEVSELLNYMTVYIRLVWEKSWDTEEVFEKIAWVNIKNNFWEKDLWDLFDKTISMLSAQLDSESGPNWFMNVVIWNEAGWTIIHEAIWHWLEADLQNSSVYSGKVWEKIWNENVSVIDDPSINEMRWFYSYDHEWEESRKTTLVENWVLKSYLHTNKTANKFWVESSWHARRENYKYKTLVRMWNTYLAPWKDKKDEVISKIKDGIYVSRMWWWQVNPVSWDFVFAVNFWYKIENGKLWKSIKGSTISGNGPDMLNNVFAVCDDLHYFDHWTCWKGQAMPVSDACPSIWTKLKVSSK